MLESTTLSLFSAGGGAGAWSFLRILFGIADPLVMLGGWRRWRVERPQNSLRSLQSSTLSLFVVDGGAGAWSVLAILFGIDDLLVILGDWCWRAECPQNSFRSRRPCRGFRRRWRERPENSCRNRPPSAVFGGLRRWRVERPETSIGSHGRHGNAFVPVPRGAYIAHTQHRTCTAPRTPQQLHRPCRPRRLHCTTTATHGTRPDTRLLLVSK